jgi:hypothetical protein
MAHGKGSKSDYCWSCGTRLDAPYNGVSPESHGCGQGDCVRCPKCGHGICEYDENAKASRNSRADKAERLKGMVREAGKRNESSAGGSGGKGGSGGDPRDPKDFLPAVDPFPVHVFPAAIQRYVLEVASGPSATSCRVISAILAGSFVRFPRKTALMDH